jgi:hypothetical protein
VTAISYPIELRQLAVESARDRLGIERRVAECDQCGCALYARDLREVGDAIPCGDDCTAAVQLEALYP